MTFDAWLAFEQPVYSGGSRFHLARNRCNPCIRSASDSRVGCDISEDCLVVILESLGKKWSGI